MHPNHRLRPALALVLALACAACAGGDPQGRADVVPGGGAPIWTPGLAMYRGTPQHTGEAAPGESLRIPPEPLWEAGPINVGIHTASKSSPVADESQLYVGADDERLYAFDKVTGEHRWTWHSRPCRNGIHATPAVDEQHVYIADYAGWLSAVDKLTGELVWETQLGDTIGASPVLVGDRIYIGVETNAPGGYLAAVDRATGAVRFVGEDLGDHTHATPTLDPDGRVVFLGSNRGLFHALAAETGAEVWRFAPRGALDPWPPAGERPAFHAQIKSTAAFAGDAVLFTSWDHHLYCLDAATGEERWRFETGERVMSSPTVDRAGGTVYVGSHDDHVYAVDLATGRRRWARRTGGSVYSSGVLVPRRDGGAVLVIGSADAHVYALDAATGAVAWQAAVDGAVTGVPLVADGRLYVSTNGGDLLCWE